MKLSYIFTIFVIVLIVSGCKTGPPNCIHENMTTIEMKYGTFSSENRTFEGYKIYSTGQVQIYKRDSAGVEVGTEIGYLDSENLCKAVGYYYWVMKKVQTCYEPGKNLKYLTFINDNSNTYWNVIWNDDFSTGSNKFLKVVRDSLEKMIEQIN